MLTVLIERIRIRLAVALLVAAEHVSTGKVAGTARHRDTNKVTGRVLALSPTGDVLGAAAAVLTMAERLPAELNAHQAAGLL